MHEEVGLGNVDTFAWVGGFSSAPNTLPPAELAAHPASADGGGYELYLMCDDIEATIRELKAKGVEFSSDVTRQRWGLITAIELPGGGRLGLYEPLHASPLLPAR